MFESFDSSCERTICVRVFVLARMCASVRYLCTRLLERENRLHQIGTPEKEYEAIRQGGCQGNPTKSYTQIVEANWHNCVRGAVERVCVRVCDMMILVDERLILVSR